MKTKTKKAISLIVLVITIIVLAILAAAVVITITNSGLINSSKDSKDSYNVAQEKSQIDVTLKDWAVTKVTQTEVTFIDFMKTAFGADRVSDNEDGTINITMQSGNIYTVKADGTITLLKGIVLTATGMPMTLTEGTTVTGTLSASLLKISGEVTWANENNSVATISSTTGESITVTAVAKGETKITASCSGYTAEYTVVVTQPITLNVGEYVIYDVTYTDVYQGNVYDNSTEGKYGWRYLGKVEGTGEHRLISTGIPMILYYHTEGTVEASKWWDSNTSLDANVRAANGMLNNFNKIPYTKQTTGNGMTDSQRNTAIGRFAATSITNNGETYNAVGDYFKASGKTYTNEITVRTLSLAELNRAVNSANAGVNGYTDRTVTSTEAGFKDLTGDALGLFDMQDLPGYTANYYYWLASPKTGDTSQRVYYVHYSFATIAYNSSNFGVRPVVILPSNIEFEDVNEDGIYEIVELNDGQF